ncbi:MAG: hypothetical protein AB7F22_17730 [Reyranella sp.]|uniref:hypothetical protein n=1 Tax=Reyranella sp. TaxID=1929291 RepID=UPI003D0B11B9
MPIEKPSDTKQRLVQLSPGDFNSAEQKRNIWDVVADADVEPEHVVKPEYWAHVSAKLREWDRIEVRHCAGLWLMELVVRSAGHAGAQVAVLRKTVFSDSKIPESIDKSGFRIDFVRGRGWRVLRKSDQRLIKDGFRTVSEAAHYIEDNLQVAA